MIDTHCHVDRFPRPDLIAKEAERRKIVTVAVTNLPSHFRSTRHHLAGYKYLFPALGLHPLAANCHEQELQDFLTLVSEADYIGEIGLDFSREGYATKNRQVQSFRLVLESLASTRKKLITLHSRQAEEETLSMLSKFAIQPVVFHWYTGPVKTLTRLLEAGHYVSVNPAMITSPKWQSMFNAVPQDRILTETDAPFVKTSGQAATPKSVHLVLEWLATRWQMTAPLAEKVVFENCRRISRGQTA